MVNNTIHPNREKVQYIIDCLPMEELLAQLAEECCELAQAALKLRRVEDGTNPARIPKEDAIKNLLEEVADVRLSLSLLIADDEPTGSVIRETMARKTDRWAEALDWGSDV